VIVVALAALIALPMVKIEKDYVFGGPNGKRPLQLGDADSVGNPLFSHILFSLYLALFMWVGCGCVTCGCGCASEPQIRMVGDATAGMR
jgi:predicted dithiol-disulfide oxidoreductase (DUF899 family)